MEFMDSLCIECVREEMGISIPPDTMALLLIEVDGDEIVVTHDAERVEEICVRSGAIHFRHASGRDEVEGLWEARREVSPSLMRLRPHKISEDVVIPRNRMAELVFFLGDLGQKLGLPIPAFGHAGDGNIHVNIMLDKGIPREVKHANEAVVELFKKVIEMGGTISGEHGIGITKAPYLDMEISQPALELMYRVKQAFDPKGILNPGKIFL